MLKIVSPAPTNSEIGIPLEKKESTIIERTNIIAAMPIIGFEILCELRILLFCSHSFLNLSMFLKNSLN